MFLSAINALAAVASARTDDVLPLLMRAMAANDRPTNDEGADRTLASLTLRIRLGEVVMLVVRRLRGLLPRHAPRLVPALLAALSPDGARRAEDDAAPAAASLRHALRASALANLAEVSHATSFNPHATLMQPSCHRGGESCHVIQPSFNPPSPSRRCARCLPVSDTPPSVALAEVCSLSPRVAQQHAAVIAPQLADLLLLERTPVAAKAAKAKAAAKAAKAKAGEGGGGTSGGGVAAVAAGDEGDPTALVRRGAARLLAGLVHGCCGLGSVGRDMLLSQVSDDVIATSSPRH